jgi:hypothetical protein
MASAIPAWRASPPGRCRRTVFEAKRNLAKEWQDVARRMPDYLAAREKKEREKFIGIASDGWQWAACELEEGKLVTIKEIILDPEKPEVFLKWLDGVVARKSSLPPEALTIRVKLGQDWAAFRRSSAALASLWERPSSSPKVALSAGSGRSS